MNTERFKGKGKAILGEKPESLNAFLRDEEDSDMSSHRHDGMTVHGRPKIKRKGSDRTIREEFRCTPELADRLSTYVFEQKKMTRNLTKTDVVHEALEGFLEKNGY